MSTSAPTSPGHSACRTRFLSTRREDGPARGRVRQRPGRQDREGSPKALRGQGHYVKGPRKSFSGGAGLVSTARDYATFLEALRNGGALGKVRILSPHAVKLMTTNQIGDLKSPRGLGFGYGFETHDKYGVSGM